MESMVIKQLSCGCRVRCREDEDPELWAQMKRLPCPMPTQHNLAAEAAYRMAWTTFRSAGKLSDFSSLACQQMDALQMEIALGPFDPRWQEYIDTLPGFDDYWAGLERKAMRRPALK